MQIRIVRGKGTVIKTTATETRQLQQAEDILGTLATHSDGLIKTLSLDAANGITKVLKAIEDSNQRLPLFDGIEKPKEKKDGVPDATSTATESDVEQVQQEVEPAHTSGQDQAASDTAAPRLPRAAL